MNPFKRATAEQYWGSKYIGNLKKKKKKKFHNLKRKPTKIMIWNRNTIHPRLAWKKTWRTTIRLVWTYHLRFKNPIKTHLRFAIFLKEEEKFDLVHIQFSSLPLNLPLKISESNKKNSKTHTKSSDWRPKKTQTHWYFEIENKGEPPNHEKTNLEIMTLD